MDGRTKEARAFKAKAGKSEQELLADIRDRHKVMSEDDRHNRIDSLEDVRFVNLPGAQWSENMKTYRGDRPCYEYNKVRVRCKRVVNDMRDNRPAGKVRAVEGGDVDIAEIYEGLIRNIWNVSHADNATDYAAEYQVEGGMGCWRIRTEYSDDSAFTQDIIIEGIENPFQLYTDPSARDFMKRDAEDWIYTERISYKAYERKYGKQAEKVDFEVDNEFEDDYDDEWTDEETVRIAEYWYKIPHKKDLWLLDDGTVVDSEADEATPEVEARVKDIRTVKTHKIMMVVASGAAILEGPVEWAGHYFPWVMVHGEFKNIEGRNYWWGLVRHAKDAQRNYNISKTSIAETIAQAPKSKYWATSTQAAGHTDEWAEADKKNFPYQLYEADPKAPGPPIRMGAADVPVALMQQAAIDNEDLKDVMGLPDASMGNEGGEKSGRAIYARQQQGAIATFNYPDNMSKAVEYTMELLIDLIPEIYDTERELRVLGIDGKEAYKRVNQVTFDERSGKQVRINDLSMGKYDVTVTSGPNFSTLRQEAAETYSNFGQQFPEMMAIAGDLIMKSMDLPYADEIAERMQSMLPPQIQQTLNDESEMPPEIQQMMQQAQAAMQQVQEHGQLVQAAAQELEEEKSLNAQQKAEIKAEVAGIDKAQAQFDAHMAKEMLKLIQTKAGITTQEANLTVKGAEVKEAATQAGVALDEREDGAMDMTTQGR